MRSQTARGPIAQLEERFNGIEEAVGSSPTGSTKLREIENLKSSKTYW